MKTKELIEKLVLVKPGLSNNDVMEQTNSFAFLEDYIVTYNDTVSVRVPIEPVGFSGAIKADRLYNFLQKVDENMPLLLKLVDNNVLLKIGKARVKIAIEKEIVLPLFFEFGEWRKIDDLNGFREGLSICVHTAAKDYNMPVLTNIYVKKDGEVLSSDSVRLTKVDTKTNFEIDLLLPAESVKQLLQYDFTDYQIDEKANWIHFKTPQGVIFSIRLYKGTFPKKVNEYLNLKGGVDVMLSENLLPVLERAYVFAKRDNDVHAVVEISCEGEKIQVQASDQISEFVETVQAEQKMEKISFLTNPEYLRDVLKITTKGRIVEGKFMIFEQQNWFFLLTLSLQ